MKIHPDVLQGIVRWAKANRSDPFAFNRAMSHTRNRVASHRSVEGPNGLKAGDAAFYNATPYQEGRFYTDKAGIEHHYSVIAYRDLVRP